jgi:AmmeMemoRadiSam system protein B
MALIDSTFTGSWFPATKKRVEEQLADFARKVNRPQKLKKAPVAGIVPHAGWTYSGAIAYEVWANLVPRSPNLVVLFGGHMHGYHRSSILTAEGFNTPLGPLLTHPELTEALTGAFRFKTIEAGAWEPDNTVEVQLPMIKHLFPKAQIVVLHLPPRDIILDIVDLLMELVRRFGLKGVFVGTTDLTHYGPRYGFTPHGVGERAHRWAKMENDAAFIAKLTSLDPQGCLEEGLSSYNACCPGAAASAVTAARLMGSEYGELLTQTTSFEVMSAVESEAVDFVGYCSVVF